MRILFLLLTLFCATQRCIGQDGRVAVRIIDEQGAETPARAWVDVVAAGGKSERLFQPASPSTATPYAKDRSFSCDGRFSMIVPSGNVVVHVERGKEYVPVDMEVDIAADRTTERTIRLERWIDMPADGWYSSDMHIHLGADNPRVLGQLALADDVHLIPSFTYWLRGRGEIWRDDWPNESFTDTIQVDERHLITRNNLEIERISRSAPPGATVGATFLYNLSKPVTADHYGEFFPTDASLCLVARDHSPGVVFDSDKPSWAETVVGAALDALDTIQVCHNHFHRLRTIRGGYGMIGSLSAGESNEAVGDGLFHRTNSMYYRFLNCGFQLGVSGGSAIGVMPVPAGYNRVYARIDGPLTAQKMWSAIRAGRSFATAGPMLDMQADGKGIGSTIEYSTGGDQLDIVARVRSIEPLECLQVIHNGEVIATRQLLGEAVSPLLEAELNAKVAPTRSGWIVSRALFRAPDGLLRQAHTSPIYIHVDGKPTAFSDDARYMLRWIDRLRRIAKPDSERFPSDRARAGVLVDYDRAAARYQQIIADAKTHWDD